MGLRQQRVLLVALMGAWGSCVVTQEGRAAPPLSRMGLQLLHPGGGSSAAPEGVKLPVGRLDLAPPVLRADTRATIGFLPAQHRSLATEGLRASLPTLGAAAGGAGMGRVMSRPEMLAHNFKREGLPLARLFQNENSLLHIGLSPKGKPGLWFVEKLH